MIQCHLGVKRVLEVDIPLSLLIEANLLWLKRLFKTRVESRSSPASLDLRDLNDLIGLRDLSDLRDLRDLRDLSDLPN